MAHGAGLQSSRRPLITAALPAFFSLLLWAAPASPTTRYVSNTDPTCGGRTPCYATIQVAVTVAQPGDTIQVQAGTYVEQVQVHGKNDFAGASEAHRLTIEADPALATDAVVIDGAVGQCTFGYAVRFQQSRFVTLRGFTITGAGGTAIHLMGGNNQNEAIHLERNRIFGNGGPECSGGITVNRGNPGTLIANNLIYGNGRHGLVFLDQDGGPHYVVGNTIHANGWTGVWVARDHQTLLANNAVTGNGTAAGSTGGRFGITREATTVPDPPGIQLLNNLVCGNRLGEITGPALDDTDAGNLTPTGTEGPGVGESLGCQVAATVYAGAAGPDGVFNTGDDDFTLAAASPALDAGIDPRTLELGSGLDALFEASFLGPASRPGGAAFDIGAMETGGGATGDTQAPAVAFVRPEAAAFVRQLVPVEARATDDGSAVAVLLLVEGGQVLDATLTPSPPAAVVTATATWDTTGRPDGAYTLIATATDGAGNTASATRVVIVDNTPPDTEITGGPTGFTTATSATFTFTGSDVLTATGDLVFAWRLDGAAYSDFSSATTATVSELSDGAHTFEVKARDRAGNEDPTPAARGLTVDTTAPDTEITGGPSGTIAATTATFTFTGSDALTATADLVFAWRLDGGAYTAFSAATSATLVGLTEGPHTFEVKARDRAGHEDPTPATASFTVTLPPPAITGLVPDRGPIGTLVSIHGTHFGPTPGDNQVRFAGGAIATVQTATTTALTVVVPAGAATGAVTVTRGGHTGTSPTPFTVIVPFPGGIALTPAAIVWGQHVGIDHHEPTNALVVSSNYPGGFPHVFELASADGSRVPFSPARGFADEVKIATVRSGPCQGGFTPGQLFSGTGVPGRVARVAPEGGVVDNPWVVLPGETGLLRGALFHDRYCVAGGDLIVVTTAGNVWRITAAGVPTLVASLGPAVHIEGVTTVPDDPVRYGPWAGKILAGAENIGRVAAVDPQGGGVTLHNVGLRPEDLDVIPASENFYAVDFLGQRVLAAPAAAFAGMVGDLLVTEETPGRLWHVRWDAATGTFPRRLLAEAAQFEHVAFSPAALPPLLPLPEALFLVIDADSLASGTPPNFLSDADLNQANAAVGQRAPLPFFASHAGTAITLHTGTVGDEGWLAVTAVPPDWAAAGPTAEGLRNYVLGSVSEPLLAGVPGVTPLRAEGLSRLAGTRVCALVYQGDVGVSYGPLTGDLRGPTLGLVAFEVLAATTRAGALGGALPEMTVQILNADEICGARLSLYETAPAPSSPAEPFDVEAPGVAPVRALFVTPVAAAVPVGLTAAYRATAIRANGVREDMTAGVTWASETPAVATISAAGVATAVAQGATTITAAGAGRTAAGVLAVIPPVFVSLVITPAAAEIEVGGTQAFTATVTLSDGSTQIITATVTWSSTTPAVATVNGVGLAFGLAPGTTSIGATRAGIPPATATLVVRPRPPTVFGPLTAGAAAASGTGTPGASVQVFVNGTARGAATGVSAEGLWTATGLAPAFVAAEVVTARETLNAVTSPASAPVTVIDGAVRTIGVAVTPFTATVPRGRTWQFTATAITSDGLPHDVTAMAAWSSSNGFLTYVNPAGLATGLNPGVATVAARFEGVTGTASLTVGFATVVSLAVSPAAPLLFVNQTQPMTVTGTFTDGTSRDQAGLGPWTSSDTSVATVTFQGVVTARAAGTATITVTQGALSASAVVTVSAVVPDGDFPVAEITAPAANATVTAPAAIVGTATDPNFYYYVLEVALAGETSFTPIATGTTPVVAGSLGTLDPTLLVNDFYTVRLRVVDRGGNVTTTETVYQVDRHLKVGLFTLAFQDLTVPLAGLPITVVRVYDSRDKRMGDFGVGWRLDLQTLRIRANRVPGTRWHVDRVPGFPVDTYVLTPTDAHTVSLTLPDGTVEAFELTPSPASQAGVPFLTVDAAYTPKPGTLGALRALEGTALVVEGAQPGPVTLLDVNAQPYYPRRWEYTAADGKVFVLDRQSGVESVREPNGHTLTVSATGITHSAGPRVQFVRDGAGRIFRVIDPKGFNHIYAYDGAGDLAEHADPHGHVTRFLYDGRHGLLEVRDPRGVRALKNEYDAAGRLIATEDPDGHRITYTHDLVARQELIRDRLGNPTLYEYDDEGNILAETDPLGARRTYTYDARGNRLSETDALGHVTTYTYDARNNRLSETRTVDGQAVVTQWTYTSLRKILTVTDPLGRVTTNAYDAAGNLLSTTDAVGGLTQHTYDASGNRLSTTDPVGNVTMFTYDAAGRRLTRTDAAGTTTYTYDPNGNVLTERNPRGALTQFVYDGRNRLLSTHDPLAAVTRNEYDPAGNRTAEVSPLGFRMTFTYDAGNLLIQTTFPDGTTTQAAYDAEGNRISSTDEQGRVTGFTYDGARRLTEIALADGATQGFGYDLAGRRRTMRDARGRTWHAAYDSLGRLITWTDPLGGTTAITYDLAANRTAETDPTNRTTQFAYDAMNQLTRTTLPGGETTEIGYDLAGRKTSERDAAGRTTQFGYDALGRLASVTDAAGGITRYEYDGAGNRTAIVDARGNRTSFTYNLANRLTAKAWPASGTESSTHDPAGRLLTKTNPLNQTIRYAYDQRDRLLTKTYPDNTTVQFTYRPTGQRATAVDARGTTTYTYDSRNRLTALTYPDGQQIGYTYDPAGSLLSIASLAGTIAYVYDHSGRLQQVTDPAGRTSTYSYDSAGRRTGLAYPNGTTVAHGYDANGRLLELTHRDTIGQVLAAYAYTLSATGQRTRVEESTGRIKAYAYDSLGRLTQEQVTDLTGAPVYHTAFTYDAVGNRLTKTSTLGTELPATTTYTYNAADQLLTEDGVSYTYDLAGRLTSKTDGTVTTTYQYDVENRLIRVTTPTGTTTYAYDVDGNRIEKTDATGTTLYLVDPNRPLAQILAEYIPAGGPRAFYVYADDLLSLTRGAETHFYHPDGLGSTRLLTDLPGTVTDTADYEAFGIVIARTGITENPFLFTRQHLDARPGLYYLRARYYEPSQGRFLTRDPFCGYSETPLTFHSYLYSHADPVNHADPSGLTADRMDLRVLALTMATALTVYSISRPLLKPLQWELPWCPPCYTVTNKRVPVGTIAWRLTTPTGQHPQYELFKANQLSYFTLPPNRRCYCFWSDLQYVSSIPKGSMEVEDFIN